MLRKPLRCNAPPRLMCTAVADSWLHRSDSEPHACRPALCDTCCLDAEGKSIDGCVCDDWTEQCVEFVYQQALITSEAMVEGSINTDTATCTTTLTDKKTYLVTHLTEPVRVCCVSTLQIICISKRF